MEQTLENSELFTSDANFRPHEVVLAFRNRGMPLEGLRYSITPTGMHYLLIHFDIPYVDARSWQLRINGRVSKALVLTLPSSCIKFADKVKKSPVFQPLRMAAGSWLDFTSGEFQRQAQRADMYYRSDGSP